MAFIPTFPNSSMTTYHQDQAPSSSVNNMVPSPPIEPQDLPQVRITRQTLAKLKFKKKPGTSKAEKEGVSAGSMATGIADEEGRGDREVSPPFIILRRWLGEVERDVKKEGTKEGTQDGTKEGKRKGMKRKEGTKNKKEIQKGVAAKKYVSPPLSSSPARERLVEKESDSESEEEYVRDSKRRKIVV